MWVPKSNGKTIMLLRLLRQETTILLTSGRSKKLTR